MATARRLGQLLVAVSLVCACAASGAAGQRLGVRRRAERARGRHVAGEVLVKYRAGVRSSVLKALRRRHGLSQLYQSRVGRFRRVRIPSGKTVEQVVRALRRDPAVAYAEANTYCRACMTPNDPHYPDQWHLDDSSQTNPYGGANGGGIHVEPAWDRTQGQGVIVAVLDSGVAYENYSTGWWFWKRRYYKAPDLANTSFVPGYDFVENDSHPNDDNSHGTHVAGTIAQSTNNNTGCAGVAFQCSIMPVKVLDADGYGTAQALADGIYYATDHGAKVINMSLSWPVENGVPYDPGQTVRDAVAYAYNHGVTLVCAAGNDGQGAVAYPAAYDAYCIAVGATRYDETRASYSNTGSSLDIVAPGGDVSVDQNGDGYGDGVLQNTFNPETRNRSDFGYWYFDGTSMATPHVAGVAALVIASGVTGPDAVRQRLLSTAEDKGPAGWDAEHGAGIVDAAKAVDPGGPPIAIDGVTATPASVGKYEKVELEVALSNVAATKPYDPDPGAGGIDLKATFTGPGGVWEVNGFYAHCYDDLTSTWEWKWLIRFAPNATGTWSFSVSVQDPSGSDTWDGGTFTCTTSARRGWARIEGRYLRFVEDNQVTFAVGHNNGWQDDVEQPTFANMAANGENLLSFWLAQPWATPSARAPIENATDGLGNYNQTACAYLDGVVKDAETAGVYLLPTIWSHGQLRDENHPWSTTGGHWWYNNAYKTLGSATDFFKTGTSEQWRYQRNFYRYLLARWGYSRAVAGWVAVCEIDGTTGYHHNKSQAEAWCGEVAGYFRTHDLFRTAGGKNPMTTSKTDTMSGDAASWDSGFDLRSCDSYLKHTDDIGVAATIASETQTMWASGKPCFHGEFGGNTTSGATQPAHLHNGIWAGAAAGAAATPLVWCDGGGWPMLTGAMQTHLRILGQFMAAIPYLGDPALDQATVSVGGTCLAWGMGLADRGYAWVQNTAHEGTMGGQTLTIAGLTPGNYRVEWYDAWASGTVPIAVADPVSVGGDGLLAATAPALARADIACKFLPSTVPPNHPPVAADDSYDTNEEQTLEVAAESGVLANDADQDPGDTLEAVLVAEPSHGALLLSPDGSFTYTPDDNFCGTDTFTYKAKDDAGALSGEATATITVHGANDPPVAVNDFYCIDEDTTLVVPAPGVLGNDTDPDPGDTLAPILDSDVGDGTLTLNPDGSFTYTPDADFCGIDTFTYKASDGIADSNLATVTITVHPVNDPPVAVNDAYTVAEDGSLTVNAAQGVVANDTDVEDDPLEAILVSNVGCGSLTLNADGSFSYTPAGNFHGDDSFTYKANDGEADSNVATVAITVTPVNDPPVAVDDAYSVDQDQMLAVAKPGVLANDTDVDGDGLTAQLVAGASSGALTLNADGSFTYTPNGGFVGTDSFTYQANDGEANSNVATVTITVKKINHPPVANDDAATTDEDAAATIAVLANDTDPDPDDDLAVDSVAEPGNGTAAINPDGTVTYTPDADFNGTDSFDYTVGDGKGGSDTATVTVTVLSVNDPPIALDDAGHTDEDTALIVAVLGNDSDPDGDALSVDSVTEPANGSAAINPDKTVTYTPDADFNGTDSFDYTVGDGNGATATATVTVTVNSVNDDPVATDDVAQTDEDEAAVIAVLANDSDVDGDPLSVDSVTDPPNGTAAINPDDSVTYTPDANFHGSDSFGYTVGDGHGGTATATVVVTVVSVNDAPVANDQNLETDEDTPLAIILAATDGDGDDLTYAIVAGPAHGSLSGTPPSVTYTPDAGYSGPDSFTFKANDGEADSNVAAVSITVNPAGPEAFHETGTVQNVSSQGWTTVTLSRSYASMVVVCTPNYAKPTVPLVTRVQNASGGSFDVRVQRTDGSAAAASATVHYLVVEAGVYTEAEHGVKMEAVRFTSTVTDRKGSWSGQSRSYQNTYAKAVVLGQVMTCNDPDWSVFWCRGSRSNTPPNGTLRVGKHVGEDPDTARANETIGYIIVEAGNGTMSGKGYAANVGGDSIRGVDNSPPYTYSLAGLSSASVAIVAQAAMDGGNGGWALLYGGSPVSATSLKLAIDEDQAKDSERKHTTEQVGYIVFE